ncbi:APC family permease [Pseudomonas putida]|uniref:APC family permease n=1 Tax=Pseudomonas putida TaxID=303 RepID=UPI0015763C4B|nr:APC family permease [Pseudomonas putida]NTY90417.1 APC family permease [Pseudomonas putida]NTY98959.1 APC family permease [Pseudomonas putida]NTZ21242.1 APC family permease [Pseudomonas putida]NTZ53239.1 APC family permease [Pseudomonas putida]NTZ65111.1 APC family permease [Pseudomonas putida]
MEQTSTPTGALRKNALGMWNIVFFVLATNGPLTGLIGVVPTAILMGNGVGLPGVFLLVGAVYLLFAVGFVAMGRHIRNAGAFYAYVATGLGRPMGAASAFLAIVAYAGMQIACYGLIGFFTSEAFHRLGINLEWWVASIGYAILVQLFGTRNVEFNGRFLALLMLAELVVIVIFDIAVVGHGGGPEGFSMVSFEPTNVFATGLGAALVFVGGAFMGFETTAIYAEEARDPAKTLPRATFTALILIMLFYAVSSWLLLVAIGPSVAIDKITQDPGGVWFQLSTKLVGVALADAINILLITSLFAVLLSFHNSLSRYLFSMGRERILPSILAVTHKKHQTPYVASTLQTAICLTLLVIFGAAGADPITQVLPLGSAPATIGILAVQCLASIAVIRYFHKDSMGVSIWKRLIAPAVSALALAYGVVLIINNMSLLTGGESIFNSLIPAGMFLVAVAGMCLAGWHKWRNPQIYANLGRVLNEV